MAEHEAQPVGPDLAIGISAATANNDWSYAKGWLRLAMLGDEPAGHRD